MQRLLLIIVALTVLLPAVVLAQSDGFKIGTVEITGEVVEVLVWEPREIDLGGLEPTETNCTVITITNIGHFPQWAGPVLRTDDIQVEWSMNHDELLVGVDDTDEVEVCVNVPGDVPAPLDVSAEVDVLRLDR